MTYRWATPADAGDLARLNQQLIHDGADLGSDDLAFLTRRMHAWLSEGNHRAVLFADDASRTVAYAVFRDSGDEIYLAQFLVVSSARGHGVGHAAIELLRREIWQSGKRITLDVLVGNRPALEFWHQLGWKDCALTLEIHDRAAVTYTTPAPVAPASAGSDHTPARTRSALVQAT